MTDKVLTCATAQDAADLKAAIFKQYRSAELARRGAVELDTTRDGRPLAVQVTVQYSDVPAVGMSSATHLLLATSDPKQLTVDATVQAMQGAKVDIGAGKTITIDVSAAV